MELDLWGLTKDKGSRNGYDAVRSPPFLKNLILGDSERVASILFASRLTASRESSLKLSPKNREVRINRQYWDRSFQLKILENEG